MGEHCQTDDAHIEDGHIHALGCYAVTEEGEATPSVAAWMGPDAAMLSGTGSDRDSCTEPKLRYR